MSSTAFADARPTSVSTMLFHASPAARARLAPFVDRRRRRAPRRRHQADQQTAAESGRHRRPGMLAVMSPPIGERLGLHFELPEISIEVGSFRPDGVFI
jgi:hypothetical protein